MPMYDRICYTCKAVKYDSLERIADNAPQPCSTDGCNGEMVRGFAELRKSAVVHGDEIPGGVLIRHGLCHEDGRPRRYYSKSEIQREAQRRGLTNYVTHIPERGSDKSKHTSRWI